MERRLPMAILDAEYQFDHHKLVYFFEADRYLLAQPFSPSSPSSSSSFPFLSFSSHPLTLLPLALYFPFPSLPFILILPPSFSSSPNRFIASLTYYYILSPLLYLTSPTQENRFQRVSERSVLIVQDTYLDATGKFRLKLATICKNTKYN